jgi:hypothetical protein
MAGLAKRMCDILAVCGGYKKFPGRMKHGKKTLFKKRFKDFLFLKAED